MSADKATMTVRDAAKHLSVTVGLAYQMAREGKLPGAFRLGRRILVSRKALEAFLEGGVNHEQ